jgi:hypothetical protein
MSMPPGALLESLLLDELLFELEPVLAPPPP